MLVVYYGSDSYRLRHAVTVPCEEILDGSEESAAEQLERILKYPSFFGEHRTILLRNATTPNITELLKDSDIASRKDITLYALQDTESPSCDKKSLTKLTKLTKTAEQFEPLTGQALASWVCSWCAQQHLSVEQDALKMLLARTGTDMQRIVLELEKLAAYAGAQAIDRETVRTLVPERAERDEWELSNAFAAYDKRAAIVALWRRLQEGTSEQMLLGSCASGIRNLSSVKDLRDRHTPTGAIAKTTGLHPFVVSKTIRGADAANSDHLRRAHIELARLDRDTKSGRADTVDSLFSILLSM